MNVEKVQLTVSSIIDLLNNGYTWFKKDDLGYGSIQEKFQATDAQIQTIRKHPSLKDADTVAKIFIIVDDTKNETTGKTKESVVERSSDLASGDSVPVVDQLPRVETTAEDGFDAFKNI